MSSPTDRIEQQVLLHAPLDRVWRAVSDAKAFGTWFGAAFDGPFVAGERVSGRIVPTAVDAEIALAQKPYEGTRFDVWVERVEPMRRLAFRWHPDPGDAGAGASAPTTLVELVLEEAQGGVRLTIVESGFDALPPERRSDARASNAQGWAEQTRLVARYLATGG